MDSMNWQERDHAALWHPYQSHTDEAINKIIVRGEGSVLFDSDGRSYIDAISSWWVNLHGHSHPALNAALFEQAKKLEHVIFSRHSHPSAILLAERLLGYFPDHKKVFYSDNGSTAVEVAIKMALQFQLHNQTGRNTFLTLDGAYHGDTFGAMSVSAKSIFTLAFEPYLFDVLALPPLTEDDHWLKQFEEHCSHKEVAAFIYEPCMQGSAGMRVYAPAFLERMLQIAKAHGVLLIADEVFTGFGRTSTHFVCQQMSVQPDMVCLSKGITGGYMPFGATLATGEIYSAFATADWSKTFFHGHSYTGNPLACAVAIASLDELQSAACENKRSVIIQAQNEFAHLLRAKFPAMTVRHMGTMVAWDVPVATSGYLSPIREQIIAYYSDRGILIRPLGNTIYLLPPYCISEEQLKHLHEVSISYLQQL
jgi:adenosylmethionine---8-amino-7-oxononanoate aminotransferase